MSLNQTLPNKVFVESEKGSRLMMKLIQKDNELKQCGRDTITDTRISIILDDKGLSDLLQEVLRNGGVKIYSIWGHTDKLSLGGDLLSNDEIYAKWRNTFSDSWSNNYEFKLFLIARYNQNEKLIEIVDDDTMFINEIIFLERGF